MSSHMRQSDGPSLRRWWRLSSGSAVDRRCCPAHSRHPALLLCLRQIIGRLQIHPQPRGRPQNCRQIQSRLRGHAALALDQFIETRLGPAELAGKRYLGDPPRLEELLEQDLPRMKRINGLPDVLLLS
jgi:hypothetical protein